MKHAFLITAFNQPVALTKLIQALDDPDFDIFLHVDKKSALDPNDFTQLTSMSTVHVVKQHDVTWGGVFANGSGA